MESMNKTLTEISGSKCYNMFTSESLTLITPSVIWRQAGELCFRAFSLKKIWLLCLETTLMTAVQVN